MEKKAMDKEQMEINSLGFFAIFKSTFKIISSMRKTFIQITLSFVLPLSIIFLAHVEISQKLLTKILQNENELNRIKPGTPLYAKISIIALSEWTAFWLYKFVYFISLLVLSLLSTSAVAYTIACIYTANDNITLGKVICAVSKVWKRLMLTFIVSFMIILLFNVFAFAIFTSWEALIGQTTLGLIILCILIVVYMLGFAYTSLIWHLASVVSVLEEDYGIKAVIKSKGLIKGKISEIIAIFIVLILCFTGIQITYERYVVNGETFFDTIVLRILCLFLIAALTLFGLVIQTVIYFSCKSFQNETIDKLVLADHLEVYLGDYFPVKSNDVSLVQFYV